MRKCWQWLFDLLSLIVRTKNLNWLLLTKRPENLRPRMEEILSRGPRSGITFVEAGALALAYAFINDGGSIMHNIWLGVSVENQEMADKRIPQLLKIPAKVRFLSVEPMLGPVDLAKWFWSMMTDEGKCALDWVICGCESGRKRRPMAENWSRSLKDQCARRCRR